VFLAADAELSKVISQSVYVGPVNRDFIVLQSGPSLCLVNIARLACECAYQSVLRSFGGLSSIILTDHLPLEELLKLGILDPGSGYDSNKHAHVDMDGLVAQQTALLNAKAEMLNEYLSIGIAEGKLASLPNALNLSSTNGLVFDGLPLFLLRLCCETSWEEEKLCFDNLCRLTADFFAEALLPSEESVESVYAGSSHGSANFVKELNASVASGEFEDVAAAAEANVKRARLAGSHHLEKLQWLHEAICRDGACQWPAAFAHDGTVIKLASLDQLYRIFERC